MTIENEVAALTTSTTALVTAVGLQQTAVTDSITAFTDVTTRVNTELNLVENTADIDKPISTSTQAALDLKQLTLVSGVNISTVNGISILGGEALVIARSATSLNKVEYEDRGTLRSTVSEVDDSTVVEGLGLFMFVDNQDEPDDDETCFTTATGQWLLRAPAWDLISAWGSYDAAILEDFMEDEPSRFATYLLNNT
tara:strand:- start:1121 stop:1711 length:591 start_codon:yes stop_codon:yes gene_type:complete